MTDHDWSPWPEWSKRKSTKNLVVGDRIAFDHAMWRVHEVTKRDPVDVVDQRDYMVILRPINLPSTMTADKADKHWSASAYHSWSTYPNDHYPVCAVCHEPQPCRDQLIEKEVTEASERMQRYEIPGVCPSCSEPVTTRHLRQTWPDNLVTMSGQPVTFHLRQKCADEARRYDREWIASGRASLLGYRKAEA